MYVTHWNGCVFGIGISIAQYVLATSAVFQMCRCSSRINRILHTKGYFYSNFFRFGRLQVLKISCHFLWLFKLRFSLILVTQNCRYWPKNRKPQQQPTLNYLLNVYPTCSVSVRKHLILSAGCTGERRKGEQKHCQIVVPSLVTTERMTALC